MHLQTIGDVLELSESDFTAVMGVGGHSIIAFAELKADLNNSPEKCREAYHRNLARESVKALARMARKSRKRPREFISPAQYADDQSLLTVLPSLFVGR